MNKLNKNTCYVSPDAIMLERHPNSVDGQSRSKIPALLVLVLLGGLVFRFWIMYSFDRDRPQLGDEGDYHALALMLTESGEFAFERGRPISIRPPLYPAFVAINYWVFGSGSFDAIRVVQVILSMMIPLSVYGMGSLLYSRRIGLVAAGFGAIYPSLAAYCNMLLTETLFTTLLCAVCYVIILAYRRSSIGLLAIAGFLMGLAALTRSALWPFPAVLAMFLLLTWRGDLRYRLFAAVSLGLAAATTIAPWSARNTRLERTFMAIDCMGGRNMMMGNYEFTPMFRAWDAISEEGDRAWHSVLHRSNPTPTTQGQKDKSAMRYGLKYIIEHPWLTFQRDVVKFINFWGLEREIVAAVSQGFFGDLSKQFTVLIAFVIASSFAMALLSGIFGAIMVSPVDWRGHTFLLLVIAFLTAVHTVTFGHSRYHVPLMPIVMIYSASAAVRCREIWQARRNWKFWAACITTSMFVLAWILELTIIYRDDVAKVL